jgi:hypothetical protein
MGHHRCCLSPEPNNSFFLRFKKAFLFSSEMYGRLVKRYHPPKTILYFICFFLIYILVEKENSGIIRDSQSFF